jgi:hypothetical protein
MTTSVRKQLWVLIVGAVTACAALGAEELPSANAEYAISLQYEGAAPASAYDFLQLYDLAVAIVESSNGNSRHPLWNWDLADILAGYRRAVDGRYLVITYATPRMMTTIGGDLMVKEIVIGLNGSQYASSLHTVDDEGRVVGHAMYSGELCVKLLQLVESMERHLTRRSSGP